MKTVYLAFGSNLGDKVANIASAMCALEEKGVELLDISSLYETEPYGVTDQPAFLNCVGKYRYSGTPERLLDIVMQVEKKLHRKREIRWGPRTIDIDILLFGNEEYKSERLILPHYDMQNRSFVLVPLLEISPNISEPGTGIPYRKYLELLSQKKLRQVKTPESLLEDFKNACACFERRIL
ncbi:hypothetical protein AT15_02950 [Kosmotoga arenicorallina S304]|uniref:2-amino-4-hydroxy-6-hydroxymethyldihydropteridine diphosphokinase n=1 Tax=Kosmotoga arenicorallina S304 TaxID=1453497 RepID=A0A176K458_9BACT|nr:2-amino-4-hydroxy-6-hydroxymethyldihydropteridine diphosphokinase [Kosmotoga arenicorallina]OAA31802.1 hypothetical protein AT15_02950 [Kosmotoga arenicorallina S304]